MNKLYTQGGSRSYDPNRRPHKTHEDNFVLGGIGFALGCIVGAAIAILGYSIVLGMVNTFINVLMHALGG